MVSTAPQSAAVVLAAHVWPTFDAGIRTETLFKMRLCYVIDLDSTAFWGSRP